MFRIGVSLFETVFRAGESVALPARIPQ